MTKARKEAKKIFVFSNFRVFVINPRIIKCEEITIKILKRIGSIIQYKVIQRHYCFLLNIEVICFLLTIEVMEGEHHGRYNKL